ncbi:hypothetical protein LB505_001637 [Fusarium chuoi]|nr:hypothetical protein LB505_001637 [Fusarium chuoi]
MELIHLKVDEDETGEITDETFFDMAERLLDDNLQTFGITGSDHDLALAKKNHEPPAPTHGLVIDAKVSAALQAVQVGSLLSSQSCAEGCRCGYGQERS